MRPRAASSQEHGKNQARAASVCAYWASRLQVAPALGSQSRGRAASRAHVLIIFPLDGPGVGGPGSTSCRVSGLVSRGVVGATAREQRAMVLYLLWRMNDRLGGSGDLRWRWWMGYDAEIFIPFNFQINILRQCQYLKYYDVIFFLEQLNSP